MTQGRAFQERELQLTWYTEQLPGKEGEEDGLNESGGLEQEEAEDDGYTPPHEDSLPRERTESETVSETAADIEELNEHLLDEEEDDGENEERSWKRRNNGEE